MQLQRLILQLLIGAHACAHALPDDFHLHHSLHRRMPPARPPPPNSPGPGAGRATNQALDPATGVPTQFVDPVTGRPISDVNLVTGHRRQGFDALTGQLNEIQLGASQGRTERFREFGPPRSPQHIPQGSAPGPPRGGNLNPEAGRPGNPPGHPRGPPPIFSQRPTTPLPDYRPPTPPPPNYRPPTPSLPELRRVERNGAYLYHYARDARQAEDDWDAISQSVSREWPAINIDKDYHLENTPGSPELAEPWTMFMTDPMVTVPGNLGPWTRTIVKTRADDPQILLDLAVYPSQSLVVFIKIPSDEPHSTLRLLSELMYQSLRRFNPRNRHGFEKFLYPDPPTESEIARAQLRVAFAQHPDPRGNLVIKQETMGTHYYELTGSAQAAPISYMISKHPGGVAGEITEFVSLGGRNAGRGKAVMIKLGNYDPQAGRHGTPRHNPDPRRPHIPPPPSMVEAKGRGLDLNRWYMQSLAADERDWPAIGRAENSDWPRIDMDRIYEFETTPGSPELAEPWTKYTTTRNLGPWTRATVRTTGVESQLLLDLALYPQDSLVVFIEIPSDKILRRLSTERLHSRLLHEALRRFGADYRPKGFLYPNPPHDTDIWMAQARAMAFSETYRSAVTNNPGRVRDIVAANPRTEGDNVFPSGESIFMSHFYELIGSRQTAPIGFMIGKFPGDVAGPIDKVVVLKEPSGGEGRAVLIELKPRRSS